MTLKKAIHELSRSILRRRFCRQNQCWDCVYRDFVFDGVVFRGNRCKLYARK